MAGFDGKVTGDKELRKALKKFGTDAEKGTKELVVSISALVQSDAIKSIQRGTKTGRVYKRGSVEHQASAPGEAPATDTGALVSSTHRVDGELVAAVGTGLEYGRDLEFGTKKMKARPWLFPALESARPAWERGLRDLMKKLKRTKR